MPVQGTSGASTTSDTWAPRPDHRLAVPEFVPVAIGLARALDEWHQRHGPHACIGPDAFRTGADPDTYRVVAGRVTPAAPMYAAPEQTGRLERGVDERTDLYALGVLFYQLLGGRPPFCAETDAEWWRRHLTEPPPPLTDLAWSLPPALRDLVGLLLEKSPDDRYQTARGLVVDLARCRDALAAGTVATPLLLRMDDVADRIVLSGRVYGRDRQRGRLQLGYERVAAGGPAELIAVTADAGLGKWTTVADFADSVVAAGGQTVRAVCGRADPAPYAAVGRLLTDLAGQLTDAPAEHRSRIANAVGTCGTTLFELVPALADVLGDRKPLPDGSIAAARSRMHLAARRLVGAVATAGRPLVIAVANVQWADPPTVELLRYLLAGPDAPPVLAVVTYRPGDLDPCHPFQELLDDDLVPTSTVALRPLPDTALAGLLADTLHSPTHDSSRLSRTIAARTGSNPLLVGRLLHELADRQLLEHGTEGATWHWHERLIDNEPKVADVTELVRARLTRFSARTRELLDLAAAIGPRFDTGTLAAAASCAEPYGAEPCGAEPYGAEPCGAEPCGAEPCSAEPCSAEPCSAEPCSAEPCSAEPCGAQPVTREPGRDVGPDPVTDVAGDLLPAVRAELLTAGAARGEYRWRHEQVRQAVLACAGGERRGLARLAVGRALRPRPERLFEAVAHLDAAIELVPRDGEEVRLAELNLEAGRRAGRLGALAAAREYLAMGLDLLGTDAWCRPDVALPLHLASADAERAAGNTERAERLLEMAAGRVTTDTDRARLLAARAVLRHARGDPAGALRTGIETLQLLGQELADDPAQWTAAAAPTAVDRVRRRLDQGALGRIVSAPDCAEPRVVIAANLIADLVHLDCRDPAGSALLLAVGVDLAADHGPTAATGFTLARFAHVLAQHRHDSDAGRCALASLRLLDTPDARYPALARAAAAVVGPLWLESPHSMIRELYAAHRAAVELGETESAQRIGAMYAVYRFAAGTPLDQVAADIDARWRFARRHGMDERASAVTRLLDEAVSRLRGLPCHAPPVKDELIVDVPEPECYSVVGLMPMLTAAHLLGEVGDGAQDGSTGSGTTHPGALAGSGTTHPGALDGSGPGRDDLADAATRFATGTPTTLLTAEIAFLGALSLTARSQTGTVDEWSTLETLASFLDDLAVGGNSLFRARTLLLAAERARVGGNWGRARSQFDRAISAARECGSLRLEGLAAELGGQHALARGQNNDALAYLRRARSCYQRWGAHVKVDQLDQLIVMATPPESGTRPLDQLDLLTVVRGFQAISGELRLDRLVGVLLELLVQHSQADRGCLLLADDGRLRPAAEAEVIRDLIRISTRVDGRSADRVPGRLIEFAGQTRQVLVGGPAELTALVDDRYVATSRPHSMVCAPIVRRNNLLAVLYLENRRLPSAFSPKFLQLLDVLRTQAAIALENATVHAQLVAANQVLDATFDQLPAGLLLLDPDLSVRRASPQAVKLMGLPIAPGTRLVELIDALTPTDEDGRPLRLERNFATAPGASPEPIHRVVIIVTPGGERLRLSTSSIPLRDDRGALVGVTVLVSPAD